MKEANESIAKERRNPTRQERDKLITHVGRKGGAPLGRRPNATRENGNKRIPCDVF